jgi:prepilin-type processing-associated H-X9-DG protein/prepilin-type N-terminal cleavage/methylation domain-containing protein
MKQSSANATSNPSYPRSSAFISGPSAFSLVELLVVIGIIALLLAILLPALSAARESSKRVQCLSNLRQMAIAAQSYVINNNGLFPVAYYDAYEGTTTYSFAWDLTTTYGPGRPTEVAAGLLWKGHTKGPVTIHQCPSYEGKANYLVDPFTGYNYNTSYIGHGQNESIPSPAKAVTIRQPAAVALFGDGQYIAGANKFMRAPFPSPGDASFGGRWAGTQGFRHRKMTNVAFCDGHAESLRDRFIDNADGAVNVAASTGFLSKDNTLYGGREP